MKQHCAVWNAKTIDGLKSQRISDYLVIPSLGGQFVIEANCSYYCPFKVHR